MTNNYKPPPPPIEQLEILNNDDKLLFSLQVIGSIQKNEKIMFRNNLPCIDDRYFQFIRRKISGDSGENTADKIFNLIIKTSKRIYDLTNEEYEAKIEENKNKVNRKLKEENEDRKRLINKYFITLFKAKQGIENLRETYEDKFIKEKLTLSITKIDENLEKLR